MSGHPNEMHRAVLLEISRLECRLATAQYSRGILIPHLEDIKSQYLAQNNDILEIRSRLRLAHHQAQALLAGNRMEEHRMKMSYITQMERELEHNLGRKDQMAARFSKVTQEIKDKGDEIRGLEHAVNGLRTRGYY